jgi:hypothetical protein
MGFTVRQVEAFVAARGFREIGSDALVENHASHAAHRGWGFGGTEKGRVFPQALDCAGLPPGPGRIEHRMV